MSEIPSMNEKMVFQILYQIVCGLHEIHSNGIIHRDIKLENILIGEDGKLKICDFGSSSKKETLIITKENRSSVEDDIDITTTPKYRAPEQCDLLNEYPLNEKVDIWGLGCIFYMICFQKFPFESKFSTISGQYEKPSTSYSEEVFDFLKFIFEVIKFHIFCLFIFICVIKLIKL